MFDWLLMIDHIYIFKSDVKDIDEFNNIIHLHNCILIYEDDLYYTLEGTPENAESFRQDWINRQELM